MENAFEGQILVSEIILNAQEKGRCVCFFLKVYQSVLQQLITLSAVDSVCSCHTT